MTFSVSLVSAGKHTKMHERIGDRTNPTNANGKEDGNPHDAGSNSVVENMQEKLEVRKSKESIYLRIFRRQKFLSLEDQNKGINKFNKLAQVENVRPESHSLTVREDHCHVLPLVIVWLGSQIGAIKSYPVSPQALKKISMVAKKVHPEYKHIRML